MPREKEGFRDQLERLTQMFPGRETITIDETAELLGVCNRTIRQNKQIPQKKTGGKTSRIVVPLVGLARWLA